MALTEKYCPNCGTVAAPKKQMKGSFIVELLLWLCFIVPGLIYSIWRLATKGSVCPACGFENVVPLNSPVARTALDSGRESVVSKALPIEDGG